eukprot:jgi/Chrzof1/2991/Cz12g07080.t1
MVLVCCRRLPSGVSTQPHPYRAIMSAQLSNLNQEVRRVKSDSRLQRQVSHVVMNETGVLKDAVQLLQQHLDELRLAQQQQANQCGRLQHQVQSLEWQLMASQVVHLLLLAGLTYSIESQVSKLAMTVLVMGLSALLWHLSSTSASLKQPRLSVGKSGSNPPAQANMTTEQQLTAKQLASKEFYKSLDDLNAAVREQMQQKEAVLIKKQLKKTVSERIKDATPLLGDFDNWVDAPVLLQVNPIADDLRASYEGCSTLPKCQFVPCNWTEVRIDSDLFVGKMMFHVRGLATSDEGLFEGKKRTTWFMVQGKFKQAAAFDDLVTGQEFHRPFKNLPARWFVEKVLLALARKISPSMVVGPLTTPYLLSPYISAAQVGTVTTQSTLTAGDKDQDSGVHGDGDGADQAADWGSVAQIWLAPKA